MSIRSSSSGNSALHNPFTSFKAFWGQHKALTKTPPLSCFDRASEPRQNIWDKRAAFDFQ